MTHLWVDGVAVTVRLDAYHRPSAFRWRNQWHDVSQVSDWWRVDLDWWRLRQWHDYFILTTDSGLLVILYHDLVANQWYLLRLYD